MSDTLESTQPLETTTVDIPANPLGLNTGGGSISNVSPNLSAADLPDWAKQATDILAELPAYLGQIYKNNKSAVITLGLFFGIIVGVKLTLAILSAINEIPLLAPTFELVGIGYTSWFVYRYLLQASTRKELTDEIDSFKSEVLGQKNGNA
ncbi:CAAD domain-containing protein [Chamaesiphon sp. GL140_3_metabinner_50]|uniref:CAAD domain-containing protein n=1 Tax=Chamaesiphon sp. GL140_3_metabinner_50 TaxID=2970812 RepID=UPI0025E0C44A|nr:CAAD domain-containing protein [Chamaesiphon sp. GL140_3_metabinner_50]